jgi:hypothetical protein
VNDDWASGDAGDVWGVRATSKAIVADTLAETRVLARLQPARLRRAARAWPRRRILALAIERTDRENLLARARAELLRTTRHELEFACAPAGDRGKFENLNALLREHPPAGHDWLLVLDDDVALPRGFLDSFIFLAERFQLRLAQPAHQRRSHAAWAVTRRRPDSVVRETGLVEIGPVTAFHAVTFDVLLPFPELRFGWGLDAHWSALAAARGWRIGVVDATPIRHGLRRVAAAYDRTDALAEARSFLADRPYTKASDAQKTLVAHRGWS